MKFNKIMRSVRQIIFAVFILTVFAAAQGLCAQPKKVAVVPFFINSPQDLAFLQNGLFDMLSSRLSDPGKVTVLDRETIDKILKKAKETGQVKGSLNESKARVMGADIEVDYILFGSLTHFGESVSLDASMVDVTGKKPTVTFFKQSNSMGDVIPMVNTFAGDINLKVFNRSIGNEMYARPQQQGTQSSGAPQGAATGFVNLQQTGQQVFQTHLKFAGQINAMAVGDLNKDGVVQVVTATDYEIIIHKLDGNRLLVDKKMEFSSTNRIVALDIADINGNGYPEIFVTSLTIHREGLMSFVLEYNGSTYDTLIDDESYYFRVVDGQQNNSKILLGQKSATNPFEGNIYTMTASGKQYATGKKLAMPRSASVLSLAQGSVTSTDAEEYVGINESGRLSVITSSGKIEWKGNTRYAGTAHYFLLPRNDPDASYQERVYFNLRILFYDVDEDGKREVFVVRNEELGGGVLGRYKQFTKGDLEILSWNGIALAPVSKTRSVQGWISDFAIADIDGDDIDELIVSVVGQKNRLSLLSKDQSSSIISYKLE